MTSGSIQLYLLIATQFVLIGSCYAEHTDFSVKTTGATQMVQFVSDAPLERIVGRTSDVTGNLSVDLTNLSTNASGSIRVNLQTLDTGLSVRNQHMRENHLHTSAYPEAVFTIRSIVSADPANISGGGTATTLLRGDLELHGVKKEYEMLGQINYDHVAGLLTARFHWDLQLADHLIPRPEFLFMKLSETQEITVELEFGK